MHIPYPPRAQVAIMKSGGLKVLVELSRSSDVELSHQAGFGGPLRCAVM